MYSFFVSDGTVIPNDYKMFSDTKVRNSGVWPENRINSDGIEEQLMFVPSKYQNENAPIKRILLYEDFNSWMVDQSISEFLSNDCPVNRCTVTSKHKLFLEMDAIIFREKYTYPVHEKTGKQVRQTILNPK